MTVPDEPAIIADSGRVIIAVDGPRVLVSCASMLLAARSLRRTRLRQLSAIPPVAVFDRERRVFLDCNGDRVPLHGNMFSGTISNLDEILDRDSASGRVMSSLLVVLSGLPGVGKTTVARAVSERVGGVHLRLDTIESALVQSGVIAAAGGWDSAPEAGYRVAYSLATDLLRAGHVVVADSVNPLQLTRQSWADAALSADAVSIDVEVVCSDASLHRTRVEARTSDLDGLIVPTWEQVQGREYEPWDRPALRVDTALGTGGAIDVIVAAIQASRTAR